MNKTQKAILALVLILPAPLIGVSCSLYFSTTGDGMSDGIEIGKVIWAIAKIWLLALPIVWLLFVDKNKLSLSPTNLKGITAGILWSIPVSIVILVTFWIAKDSLIEPDAKQKIDELGISTLGKFLIFASAMSLLNSLMEEYVWRWFVFSKFKIIVGAIPAIFLSAFFFTVHHVVIMWNFGSISLVLIGSFGLFIGAIIWGFLYNKYNSIWPGWICHVAADTAIMWITWQIITRN